MGSFERQARAMVDSAGREVEHRFFERIESDGREVWTEHEESPQTIMAIPDETGRGLGFDREINEIETKSAREYHTRDDVEHLRDGGGDRASRIVDRGTEWIVMQLDELGTGTFRLICWRDD